MLYKNNQIHKKRILIRFKNFIFVLKHKLQNFLKKIIYIGGFVSLVYLISLFCFSAQYRSLFTEKLFYIYSKTLSKNYNLCSSIHINGIDNVEYYTIESKILNYCEKSLKNEKITLDMIQKEIKKIPWIKTIRIQRKLPYTLNIDIEEHIPFALWQNKEQLHLINENGEIIEINKQEIKAFYNLIIILGPNSRQHTKSLFNILLVNPKISSQVKTASWISNRRWDLKFENNLIVKLPEKNVMKAWLKLIKLFKINGLTIDLKKIDLRIEDRIFLEYKEKTLKNINKQVNNLKG